MKSASACNTNQKAGFLHKAQKKSLPKGRLFEKQRCSDDMLLQPLAAHEADKEA